LALVGLALAAGMVAAASGGQSSIPADAASVAAGADRSGEGVAGDSDIRSIDFANVAPPGSVCADGLRFAPATIPVEDGRSPVLDIGRFTRVEIDPDVAYGDVDGDGDDEAVVHVTCSYGANATQDTVHVWRAAAGRPVHVASVGEPPASITGPLAPTVIDVAIADGRVEVTWTSYADDDPNCCPSERATIRYELDGDDLQRVGRPTVHPAP
jgi:hypothetical protein